MEPGRIAAAIEALLFVTGEPVELKTIGELLDVPRPDAQAAIDVLRARFESEEHGIGIVEIAGGFQLGTKPEHADLISRMLKEIKRIRLSVPAMETLSIVAYRQPVTKAQVEEIRGVNIDGVMKTLLERELIKIVGKKDEPGRPLLFGTTDAFLIQFALKSLSDLPPLSQFDEIAKARAAGEIGVDAPPDWQAISESQRESLEALSAAAEKELGQLDERLKNLRPPKVVVLE